MPRRASILLVLLWLAPVQTLFAAAPSTDWLNRAPLNTDTDLAGLSPFGVGRAYRYLAYILNLAALAGICYALGKRDMDWSNFPYVFFGILVGSILISALLNSILHIFTLIPILALATFLLARFCSLQPNRALAATLLYQLYQVGYLFAYKAIAARYV